MRAQGDDEREAHAFRVLEEFAERVGVHSAPASDPTALDAAAVEALEAFAAADIGALLLKGPALARELYSATEQRVYSDVDVLVAPAALPAARETLAQLGYRKVASEALGIDDVGGAVHEERWLGMGPDPHAKYELFIELHTRLPGAQASTQVAWDALEARRTYMDLRGHRVPVLNREGCAMQLATHAAQHGPGYAKGLRELGLGLERWSVEVWEGAARLAAEIGATDAYAAGLRLLPAGTELAQALALPATERLDWEIRHADTRPRGTFHLEALLEARGLSARAGVVRRSLFPSPRWIAWQFPWARAGGVRLIAAYCLHLIRAAAWAARAWRFRRRAQDAARRPP